MKYSPATWIGFINTLLSCFLPCSEREREQNLTLQSSESNFFVQQKSSRWVVIVVFLQQDRCFCMQNIYSSEKIYTKLWTCSYSKVCPYTQICQLLWIVQCLKYNYFFIVESSLKQTALQTQIFPKLKISSAFFAFVMNHCYCAKTFIPSIVYQR